MYTVRSSAFLVCLWGDMVGILASIERCGLVPNACSSPRPCTRAQSTPRYEL